MEDENPLHSKITQVTSRHIGRLLHRLDDIKIPQIALDAIKREMWLMCDDIKIAMNGEKDNGRMG